MLVHFIDEQTHFFGDTVNDQIQFLIETVHLLNERNQFPIIVHVKNSQELGALTWICKPFRRVSTSKLISASAAKANFLSI